MVFSCFLKEQIVGLLWNMSQNKRCHGHLANATVIRFMAFTYQSQFYAIYGSRSETEAQKRTIKSILHTLTRLLQDTIMAKDLLEQHLQMHTATKEPTTPKSSSREEKVGNASIRNNSPGRDITLLVRQLLLSPKSEYEPQRQHSSKTISNSPAKTLATVEKLQMRTTRQESYVWVSRKLHPAGNIRVSDSICDHPPYILFSIFYFFGSSILLFPWTNHWLAFHSLLVK